MNIRRSGLNWIAGAAALIVVGAVVWAGLSAAAGRQAPAAYPGPEMGESEPAPAYPTTGIAPSLAPPTASASPRPPATWDPALPTLIPPDATLAAFQMPPCCVGTPIYETPSPAQIVLLTQAAQALYPPTLPPGVLSATPEPFGEYLAPSGEWATYVDDIDGFSFEYPANWFIVRDHNWTIVHNLSPGRPPKSQLDPDYIHIDISRATDLGAGVSLESYITEAERAIPIDRLISQEIDVLSNGYQVIWQRAEAQMSDGGILRVFLTDNNKVYGLVVFSLNSQYIDVTERVVESFNIP